MRTHRLEFRLVAMLAAASLLASPLGLAAPARAQAAGDPPGRVGRLARLDGTVSTHGPDATQWTPAVLNFPFTSGDSLWTEPQAQAEIEIDSSAMTLAASTEFDLATLDDRTFTGSAPQGAVFLDLRDIGPGETWTLDTPRGAVQIAAAGQYEILAGDANTPTRVVIAQGAAQFTSGSLVLRGGARQMLVASGTDSLQGDVEAQPAPDAFLASMLARDNTTAPPVPQAALGMSGADQLGAYGSWQQNPQYGETWYPQVDPGWAPYSDGSWSYVEPWGWTWVDAEPWGFAPFHYGRWFQSDGRWGWTPGADRAPGYGPTYAPALVDFVAVGAVAGIAAGVLAASLRSGRGDVGWVPLGPHEAFRPGYRASAAYLGRLDRGGGWHQPAWNPGGGAGQGFMNRGAMSVAPAAALLHSTRLSRSGRGPAAGAVQPLQGGLPLQPVAQTRGLSVPAARRIGLASGPSHPAGPGPTIGAPGPRFGAAQHAPGGIAARTAAPGPIPGHGPPAPAAGAPRPPLPHIQTPRTTTQGPALAPPPHRPASPTIQRPARPAMPRVQTPRAAAPFGPRPGMPAPRMAPMMRPAAPASPHAAPPPRGGRGEPPPH
ncbi:DUF6600 domain-containing protein [Lichenicoccus sp.]|uniref:DUF6600 domain-containing protein n=1 Tax=Lichenicoccus sp. TaxID=2781899 RepID=UPI003D1294D2